MISVTDDNKMLGFELLRHFYPDISHFVTTRQEGCGKGNYATFNCTSYTGDDPEDVRHNREILCRSLPELPCELVIPYQTHGIEVRRIEAAYSGLTEKAKAELLTGVDALVTDVPGFCLCISTADCVPVLLYDSYRKVIAAVHAGWRGTVEYILKNALRVMREDYQTKMKDVVACIGPSISPQSFEVGEEVWRTFEAAGFDMPRISFKSRETGKWHIDLWEANRMQLEEAGIPVSHIELAGICTYINKERFFSARRLGIKSGRILSGIMLNRKVC